MDYSFFALGLLGAFVGYIVGDVQRQRRYRREAIANLALANRRAADRANARAAFNRNGHGHGGTVPGSDDVQTGRRAVPRGDNRARVGRHAPGRDSDFEYAPAMIGAGDDRF